MRLLLLLALTIAARVASHRDRAAAAANEAQVRMLTLRPASQVRAVRITPNPRSWSATPDAAVDWPEPPELLELYLPVAYSDYQVFAITIDKVDVGRVLDLQRVSADSNRELRLTFNSSAFGPGEYRIRLQGYTWQGQRVDAGWVRLEIRGHAYFPLMPAISRDSRQLLPGHPEDAGAMLGQCQEPHARWWLVATTT